MFADITMKWKGEEKVLRANRVLKAIAIVEGFITIDKLANFGESVKLAQLSQAYGALLRFVGFSVNDDEIYAALLSSGKDAEVAQAASTTLLALMIPPSTIAASVKAAEEDKKPGNERRQRKSRSN